MGWEPSLREHPGTVMDAAPRRVSMVRVLDGDRPATYLVDEGSGRVSAMGDGSSPPNLVAGPGVLLPSIAP